VLSIIYIILITTGIVFLLFGVTLSSSFHNFPIATLILADVLLIVMLAVSIYFLIMLPNRSRKLAKTKRSDPAIVRVFPNIDARVSPIQPYFY
jgi:hypothetical protein